MHVVATDHGAEQLGGLGLGHQSDLQVAVRDSGQKTGLDLGSIVHARRHAVRQQVQQEGFLTGGRVLDQLNQLRDLLGIQRQGRNAEGCAFSGVFTIGFQHGGFSRINYNNISSRRISMIPASNDHLLLSNQHFALPQPAGVEVSISTGGGFFLSASAAASWVGLAHSSARRLPCF